MKTTRRLIAMASALTLSACTVAPMFMMNASAESQYQITVKAPDGYIVQSGTIIKIFSLSYDKEKGAYTYTVDDTCALKADKIIAFKTGATTVDDIIKNIKDEVDARAFGDWIYTKYINGITGNLDNSKENEAVFHVDSDFNIVDVGSAGYYLVIADGKNGDETVFSQVMLDSTTPTATVTLKVDAPTLTKQIYHNELSTWGTVGDNQIGDKVDYRIITSVPDNSGYTDSGEKYKYVIHDYMTNGLTFNSDSVELYVGDEKTTKITNTEGKTYYTVIPSTTTTDGCSFEISVDINKLYDDNLVSKGNSIYTYYNATLNTNAKVALDASDDVNHNDNNAHLEYSKNPYDTKDGSQTTEKTPDVIVYDWTFYETITKKDNSGNGVSGAKFEIYKGTKSDANKVKFSQPDTAKEEYVVDPAGTITQIETKVDTDKKPIPFTIKGLDDATDYIAYEAVVPAGYSGSADRTFKLSSAYEENGAKLETLTDDYTTDGANNTDIINTKGNKLPSTGGTGTKVLYAIGGTILVGAGMVLISKKRASK